MAKEFDKWNVKKKETDAKITGVVFYEREVWWAYAGVNIGVEIDGKHELFQRPVIVVRKFNKDMALVVPTTAQEKRGNKYYLAVVGDDNKKYIICLSQIRAISSKRFFRKVGTIDKESYDNLLNKLSNMVKGTF